MPPTDGFRNIDELALAHQRVLVRVDFDVPLNDDGSVADDSKLCAALPTIRKVTSEGGRAVLVTHLGAAGEPPVSLEPVAMRLAELLGQEVYLPDEVLGDAARKVVSDLREGQVCLLENLRFVPEEAQNDDVLARKLLGLGDVYVGEAFGCAHLTHASTVALPRIFKERGVGYRFKAELEALERVAASAHKPYLGVLGGRSLSEQLPVLEVMLRRCGAICVGGAVASTLLAAKSIDMKSSLLEREQLALARGILSRARDQRVELILPVDVVVARNADEADGSPVSVGSIPDQHGAFDIGPRTLETFRTRLAAAKTVLWHGTLGIVENPAFAQGSSELLAALREAPAFGLVTGGKMARLARAGGAEQESKIGFVSTGGVASLVFIEGKRLPGIDALRG